jgi:hypothetical protein
LNPTLINGMAVVTLALICYSVAIVTEQKKKVINTRILAFLTSGIILDISATVLMIVGSSHIPITLHGFIGYSALLAMLIDTILIWLVRINHKKTVSPKLHLYTRIAYIWWVFAYFAGGFIAMFHLY